MVYPLLPSLITQTLGAGAVALGALDGTAEAVSSAVKLWAGRASDRMRRAPLIVGGYTLAVVVRPTVAAATAAWQVVALRILDRVGKGARTPPRDAFISDITGENQRGRAFGLHRGLDHLGAVLGSVTAWWLLAWVGLPIRSVIAASLVPGFAVVALAVLAVRRSDRPASRGGAVGPGVRLAGGVPPVIALLATFAFLRMPDALLILRAEDMGVPLVQVPLLWGAVSVVRAGASWSGGWLGDRVGARPTLLGGWALYAVAAAAYAAADGALPAWAFFAAVALALGLVESPERALVASLGDVGGRGAAFGTYHALAGIAALPGALVLGGLYQWVGGPAALFLSAGAVFLLAGVTAGVSARRAPGGGTGS